MYIIIINTYIFYNISEWFAQSMKLHNIIPINHTILEKILYEEIKKIPGINVANIETIKINDDNCSIDFYITPFNLLANIYALSNDIQNAVNWYICKQFDLETGQIKVNIIIKSSISKKQGQK